MRAACVMTLGLAIAAVGFAVLTQVGTENGLVPVMIALGLLNFGVAPTIALGTDMMIASAPPEKAGAVSAISETCHELGLGMGIAILGSIGTAVYRSEVSDTLPAGLPADAASGIRDTIGSGRDRPAAGRTRHGGPGRRPCGLHRQSVLRQCDLHGDHAVGRVHRPGAAAPGADGRRRRHRRGFR